MVEPTKPFPAPGRHAAADDQAVYRSLAILRGDAKRLGLDVATIAYGWSLIRMGNEMLARGTWPKVNRFGQPLDRSKPNQS